MEANFFYQSPPETTITLSPPLKIAGGELFEIKLREPTTAEVRFAETHLASPNSGPRRFQRSLVSKVTGIAEEAVSELPMSVFSRAAGYLQQFVDANMPDEDKFVQDAQCSSLTVVLNPAILVDGITYDTLAVPEPTIGQMALGDSALGDRSSQRIRLYQSNLVCIVTKVKPAVIDALPISVLNRVFVFIAGFSQPAPAT